MTAPTRLTVLDFDDDRVVCTGLFPTADGKGTHSGLLPVLLRTEIQATQPIAKGDVILGANGVYTHHPRAK